MQLLDLTEDAMLHLLSFLNYRDLSCCSLTCSYLNSLSQYDRLWKRHCHAVWGLKSLTQSAKWKLEFHQMYHDYGKYIGIYKQIREAWEQIEKFVQENAKAIFKSLQPGLSDEELDEFEHLHGIKLPIDVRCVYRFHNGQATNTKSRFGALGTITFSRYILSDVLLPLSHATLLRRADLRCPCLGIIGCLFSRIVTYVSLNDALESYPAGTVFNAFGPNLTSPMDEPDQPCDVFVRAHSFLEMFTSYAKSLSNAEYSVDELGIMRFYHEPESVAVTEHVRVSTSTAFMPMMSTISPPRFVFAYRITLSMDANVHPRYACQLETRHWVITDENGKVENVDGPGVVGEYPVMKPNAKFSYISCTSFETNSGTMHGTYTMRNLATGEAYDVVVPMYHMTCPPCFILPGRSSKPESKSRRH